MSSLSLLDIANSRIALFKEKGLGIHAISQRLIDIIQKNTVAERVSIVLLNKKKREYFLLNSTGLSDFSQNKAPIPTNSPIFKAVVDTKKIIYCENILVDERFGLQKRFRYTSLSFIVAPILQNDTILGFVSISNFKKEISPSYKDLVENLTDDFLTLILELDTEEFTDLLQKEQKLAIERKDALLQDIPFDIVAHINENVNKNIIETIYSKITSTDVQLYFFNLDSKFVLNTQSFKWFSASTKSIIGLSEVPDVAYSKINQTVLQATNLQKIQIPSLALQIGKKINNLSYINCDYTTFYVYFKKQNKLLTLGSNSDGFVSGKYKVNSNKVNLDKDTTIIIPSKAFIRAVGGEKKMSKIVESTMKLYSTATLKELHHHLQSTNTISNEEETLFIIGF